MSWTPERRQQEIERAKWVIEQNADKPHVVTKWRNRLAALEGRDEYHVVLTGDEVRAVRSVLRKLTLAENARNEPM